MRDMGMRTNRSLQKFRNGAHELFDGDTKRPHGIVQHEKCETQERIYFAQKLDTFRLRFLFLVYVFMTMLRAWPMMRRIVRMSPSRTFVFACARLNFRNHNGQSPVVVLHSLTLPVLVASHTLGPLPTNMDFGPALDSPSHTPRKQKRIEFGPFESETSTRKTHSHSYLC